MGTRRSMPCFVKASNERYEPKFLERRFAGGAYFAES